MSLILNGKDSTSGQFRQAYITEKFETHTSYTPVGTWDSNVTYAGNYRIIGDTLESYVSLTLTGSPTFTNSDGVLRLELPTGILVDPTKLFNGSKLPIGNGTLLLNNVLYAAHVIWYDTLGDNVEVVYNSINGSLVSISQVTDLLPNVWNNNDKIDLYYSIPVTY